MVNLRPPRVRRSAEVDEAILGTYLAGASSHRIRKDLNRDLLITNEPWTVGRYWVDLDYVRRP